MELHTAGSFLKIDEPLRLVHHHPGYLRAHADILVGAKEDSQVIVATRAAAESIPGFVKWLHNPGTGSIIIEYKPSLVSADDLLDHIAKTVGFSGVAEDIHNADHRTRLIDGLLDTVQEVNDLFYEASGKKADLREMIPALLLVNSVVSFALGDKRGRLPSWDSSLYKSYRIFMQFHRQEVRKREKRERKRQKAQTKSKTSSTDAGSESVHAD